MIPLFRLNKLSSQKRTEFLQNHGEKKVNIYSYEHHAFWRPDRKGYTDHNEAAGVYTLKEAYEASGHCDESKKIYYIIIKPPLIEPINESEEYKGFM